MWVAEVLLCHRLLTGCLCALLEELCVYLSQVDSLVAKLFQFLLPSKLGCTES